MTRGRAPGPSAFLSRYWRSKWRSNERSKEWSNWRSTEWSNWRSTEWSNWRSSPRLGAGGCLEARGRVD
eukprot:1126486-Rhodomonas_salina.1